MVMRKAGRPRASLNGKLPKHRRIHEEVRQKILDGTYPPGMRLPPDSEFHKQWKVNKTTVIRALNDLEREGFIVRRQGSGSYVTDRSRTSVAAALSSFGLRP